MPQALVKGIQFLIGVQYLIIKKCTPLIPLLLGIQNMMYPPKDQRGDTLFDGGAFPDVTPVWCMGDDTLGD